MKRLLRCCSRAFILLTVILFTVTLTAACKQKAAGAINPKPITKTAFLLNTVVTITVYDEKYEYALDGALEVCEQYEYLLSRTVSDSAVSRLNNRADGETTFAVDQEVWELLEMSRYYSELSGGAYDVTVEPLTALWDFSAAVPQVPAAAAIEQAAAQVDYHNLLLADGQVTFLEPYTRLDFGAIAKGYIGDKIKSYLKNEGVENAIINLGGDVLCLGSKPDGSPYRVGIQKPFEDRNEVVAAVAVADLSVVSSGVYERYFTEADVNYHHILDPGTGWPVENNLLSVTIISDTSAEGDCISTTCLALGLDKGIEMLNTLNGVYGIFITDDGEMYFSEGAADMIVR